MKNMEIAEESYERYERITGIIQELEKSSPVRKSPSWYTLHSDLMKYYRENLGLYANLHPEVLNPGFRRKMEDLDMLHEKLLKEYTTYQWFNTYDYLRYNEAIKWIVDWLTSEDLDDLIRVFKI
jgi:isocitrate/isopropylmalate dehydrogenase